MSMISEQVKELREKAQVFEDSGCATNGIVKTFRKAADTIEELSAKLADVNMERSTAYYNNGWIPCSERLPKETDWYPVTIQYDDEEPYIGISEYYTGEGEFYVCGKAGWYCDGYPVDDCITAWKERPEPYKGVE